MAGQGAVKNALRRLDAAMRSFASAHGWGPDDYRVYVHVNESWAYLLLIVTARSFPGDDRHAQWELVLDHLEAALPRRESPFISLSLNLRTFDQVAEGGMYAIRDPFTPIEEWVGPVPAA